MTYKDIAKVIPTIQAAKLAEDNVDFVKSKKKKSLVKQSVKNVVGVSLIGTTSRLIDDL